MSNDTSEEKTEPGSEKKLREAREKGQVAKSQDMITALVILACVVYMVVVAPRIVASVTELFSTVARTLGAPDMVFSEAWVLMVARALDVLIFAVFPLLAIIVFVVFIGNLIILRGFLFSTDPIKPDFKRLDPVAGFKRLFSARNAVEFFKALIKVLALGCAMFFVYRNHLPFLFGAPACGGECILASFKLLFVPISMTAIMAFMFTGLLDILLQRWLFARDQRMSHSEVKRERKDTEGSPEIRKERHRQRVAGQSASSARGEHMASFMVGARNGWIVGLRYVRGETKVPVLVHVVSPEHSTQAWQRRIEQRIPYVYDPELSKDIARRCSPGEPIPERFYGSVAELLVQEGLI